MQVQGSASSRGLGIATHDVAVADCVAVNRYMRGSSTLVLEVGVTDIEW